MISGLTGLCHHWPIRSFDRVTTELTILLINMIGQCHDDRAQLNRKYLRKVKFSILSPTMELLFLVLTFFFFPVIFISINLVQYKIHKT